MVKGYKEKLRKAIENLDKVVTELKDALLIKDSDELLNDISDLTKHAKALSKVGASKGGIARAEKLSPERKRAIAKYAASCRWAKHSDSVVPSSDRIAQHYELTEEDKASIERGLTQTKEGKATKIDLDKL